MKISLDFNKLQEHCSGLEQNNHRVSLILDSLKTIANGLDFDIGKIDEEIFFRLRDAQKDIERISSFIVSYVNYLKHVGSEFEKVESEIANQVEEVGPAINLKQLNTQSGTTVMESITISKMFPDAFVLNSTKLPDLSGLKISSVSSGDTIDQNSTFVEPWLENQILKRY